MKREEKETIEMWKMKTNHEFGWLSLWYTIEILNQFECFGSIIEPFKFVYSYFYVIEL